MMLGERKRKQRIVPDPRNNKWAHDDSKFGSKLLRKMGWSEGKGLGAREQGFASSTELKMNANFESKGLGCDKEMLEAWESGSKDFDSLLANLNKPISRNSDSELVEEIAKNSEEKNSKTGSLPSSRVRYVKRAKSKDVGLYKESDMQSILGRRRKCSKEDLANSATVESRGKNMNDYFTPKMREKLKRCNNTC